MIRRDFLKSILAAALPADTKQDFGYCPSSPPIDMKTFQEQFPNAHDGKGEVSLLHPYLEKVLAVQSLPSARQTGPDCVSQASSLAASVVAAIQVALRNQRWNGRIASEWLHFGGRCHVGKSWGISGGTHIINTCEFMRDYGCLFRKKYNKIDFTNYRFGKSDLGKLENWPELMAQAKTHKVGTLTKVTNWEEARAALKNLSPVILGSRLGFNHAKRDKHGFAEPEGTWYHAWMLLGFDDRFPRPGALLMNSHGDTWVKGPRRHNQPKGSIWIRPEVLDRMLGSYPDAYALSDYVGTKPFNPKLY